MKKFSVFTFSVFYFISLSGQVHFPDSNAIWTEKRYISLHEGFGGTRSEFYCYGLLNKDTLINGIKYHKLYYSADSVFTENEYLGGIREDSSGKIRFYGNLTYPPNVPIFANFNNFYKDAILYNFSLKIGDTIYREPHLYDTLFDYDYNLTSGDINIVSNIDSELINGKLRKVIYFKYNEPLKWIEGIGNTTGLFWPNCSFIDNGDGNALICFKQGDSIFYHNPSYKDCFYPNVNINEIMIKSKPAIYPNPVNDISYIDLSKTENEFQLLEIFNVMGDKVKSVSIIKVTSVSFFRNDYPSGIYFFKLTDKNGFSASGKFIVE